MAATPPPVDPEAAFVTSAKAAHGPRPTTPDLDPAGADRIGFTPAEAEQFREFGFVIKRGLVDVKHCAPLIDFW